MSTTKTQKTLNNKTSLYLLCAVLVVAVIVAIVGFNGKNAALRANETLTATVTAAETAKTEAEAKVA